MPTDILIYFKEFGKIICRVGENFSNAAKFSWWAFKNPLTISANNFKMLSDLLGLIMTVSQENRHRMAHIAFVHPTEGEQEIVSIWAGAGMDSDPTKRISELIKENSTLKAELSKSLVVAENAEVYIVIKCGYKGIGIDSLIYGTTDGDKAAAKVKFLRADISAAKIQMAKVGKDKWEEMYDNDELTYKKYSMAIFDKEDYYCMQKLNGERFDCCCKDFGVNGLLGK